MSAPVQMFAILEFVGIVSFAVNAMMLASDRNYSVLGVALVTSATAIGGSTVRDLLLGPSAQPFPWVLNPSVPLFCILLALLYAAAPRVAETFGRRDYWLKEIAEAVALGSLSSAGAAKAFAVLAPLDPQSTTGLGLPLLAILVGVIGTSAGLVIRDLLLHRAPVVLQRGTGLLEAILAGALPTAALLALGADKPWAVLAGFLAAFLVRLTHVVRNRPQTKAATA